VNGVTNEENDMLLAQQNHVYSKLALWPSQLTYETTFFQCPLLVLLNYKMNFNISRDPFQ